MTQIIDHKMIFIKFGHLDTIIIHVIINFSGNERNGTEAMAKYSGLVYHDLRGAVNRNDLHLYNFIGWENSSTIGSFLSACSAF